jgi:hypothetical protein
MAYMIPDGCMYAVQRDETGKMLIDADFVATKPAKAEDEVAGNGKLANLFSRQ